MSTATSEVDVLIVGAGPVGLTAALLLERLGCSVIVMERRGGPQRAPAAHVINARTFEIWRQIGLDVDHIRSHAQSPEDAGAVHWVTKLGGDVLGSLPFEQLGEDNLEVTPTPLRNLSQHRLEPLLLAEATARGIEVRYGNAWTPEQSEIRSSWLLGCDGASSAVRRSVGIEMVGPHHLQTFLMTHLAIDLRSAVGEHPGVLFWVCDPGSGGTFGAHDLDREWVYMYPIDSETDAFENYTVERCSELVRGALVDPDTPFEVLGLSQWMMSAQVAERYRHENVFLVGDSAHRFPPTGGLGLNTGVGDAHNLAWKLAAVTHGAADASLLDTYELERKPIAERNAEASLENAFKLIEVPIALGADPPDPTAVGAAIANQATHFDMLGLQLGYHYGTGEASPIRTYVPTAEPGHRLPHGWIQRDGAICSTLDLVPLDRAVTIVGPTSDATEFDLRVGTDFTDPNGWWTDVVGLGDEGVLVVRPDQHVAARWTAAPTA